jgi:hypothetical protein
MQGIDIQKIADRLTEECFEAHRGAFWWDEDERVAIAFGNDGYSTDARSQQEVEAVRDLFDNIGGRELAFATANDGYSWALACELDHHLDVSHLEAVLWLAWKGLSAQRAAGEDPMFDWFEFEDTVQAMLSEAVEVRGIQPNIAGAVLERNGLV